MSNAHSEMGVLPVVWRPQEIGEAYRMKETLGSEAVYAAGGTLLRTQWEAGIAVMPAHLIDLSAIPLLTGFQLDHGELVIGACCPLAALRKDERIKEAYPMLAEAVRHIAAPSIRNLATLGGNIASRIGDSLPALLVYEAELIWLGKNGLRSEPLEDWLANAVAAEGRVLVQIRLKRISEISHAELRTADRDSGDVRNGEVGRTSVFHTYHKVGRREAFTPSVATLAVSGRWNPASGKITDVRIAAGGGQTTPARLERTERLLERHDDPFGQDSTAEVHRTVLEEYDPTGDLFASVSYRKMTVANLLIAELWRLKERFS